MISAVKILNFKTHRDQPGLLPCDLSYRRVAIAVMTPRQHLPDGRPPLCYLAAVYFSPSALFSVSLQPLQSGLIHWTVFFVSRRRFYDHFIISIKAKSFHLPSLCRGN